MKRFLAIALATTIAIATTAAFVSAAIDAPTISSVVTGHGKYAVMITAGPSGMPNGFTVRWMDDALFASYGQQWPATTVAGEGCAMFTGDPTLNTSGGMYTTFRLGPNESIKVEIGDLFQETGVTGTRTELEYGTKYHLAAFANGGGGDDDSGLSATVSATTTLNTNCTYTQGYWKTHPSVWPTNSLTLGTVVYTQAELLSILNQSVAGNGLVSLAHQLIAAKLNIINGADPTAAAATIAAADAQIGGLVIPPVGGGYLHPSTTSSKTQILDDYNNGIIGPGHCGAVPVQESSWGRVKSLFR